MLARLQFLLHLSGYSSASGASAHERAERFARRWGYWRKVVGEVVEKFVACGILKLAWRSERGVARYVEEQYALTKRIHQVIEAREGFTCPYVPESNIICFRCGEDGAL